MSSFKTKDDASLIRFSDDVKGEIFKRFGLSDEHIGSSAVLDLTMFRWLQNSGNGTVVWAEDKELLFSEEMDELEGKKGTFVYETWYESKCGRQVMYEAEASFGIHIYFVFDVSNQIEL